MDFFSSRQPLQPPSVSPSAAIEPFAQEIGRRFSLPHGHPILTARLSPISTTTTTTSPPLSLATPQVKLLSLSIRSQPSTPQPEQLDCRLTSVEPSSLLSILSAPQVLVLDIRPHATFAQSRLPHALSLSVPSTLLKRPAFSLDKLTTMLPSSSCRRRFSAWKTASSILVYDADSQVIPDGSNIRGLLRKFQNAGFHGNLAWLKGGFAGVWREQRTLVDDGPPSPDSSEEEDTGAGYLRTKKLPSSAFQQVSTTSAAQRPPVLSSLTQHKAVAPAPTSTRPVAANPFYDNIRQNRELAHGITERIPLQLPASVISRRDDLPFNWLKHILDKADVEEGTEALAMQFYMIELREQRRLMGIMDHHSREAGSGHGPTNFPYSITAGVEKGSKNRYTNIWPFEHARVRLNTCNLDDGSDYINASHIQPLCTRRRYIATQGPLPTTFTDFWMLCWEQNIRIIVMLTKQVEGSTEKCGCYWKHHMYGPLRLELVSSSGGEDVRPTPSHSGFDFGLPSGTPDPGTPIVRRTFLLSHVEHPEYPPRKVTQLQYLAWPDFDVPEDPRGLLNLMSEVDLLRSEVDSEDSLLETPPAPVLLHCSAGIGRTGGFIVVDAVLDGIRHEIRKTRIGMSKRPDGETTSCSRIHSILDPRRMTLTASPDAMEVDCTEARGSFTSQIPSVAIPRPSCTSIRDSHGDTSPSVPSEASRTRSLSPGPPTRGATSGSSSGSGLRSSMSVADTDIRFPCLKGSEFTFPPRSLVPLSGEQEGTSTSGSAACNSRRFRMPSAFHAGESSASTSTSHLPSIFTGSLPLTDRSTIATSSFPVSVESSRSPSPTKDAEQMQTTTAFDYTDPRPLHDNATPGLLSSYNEPVRNVLEDMREQRMSLCQSLRQYVFVHRAIVEGALDIVDGEREAAQQEYVPTKSKRGPSPTALLIEDRQGVVRLSKRPSFKRRAHNDVADETGGVVPQ